jgi:transcriptional regulator with XRE-family HTH domain
MYENRAYYPKRLPTGTAAMPKHSDPKSSGFGVRLAQLRKDAGYTQQQLADEIGATRRQIAYYEGESEHPPANLLIDLARALNVTTDQLLGLHTGRGKAAKPAVSTRLERRLKLIERMPAKPKQQLLGLIDTFISAEQNRQGTKP